MIRKLTKRLQQAVKPDPVAQELRRRQDRVAAELVRLEAQIVRRERAVGR